MGGGLGRRDAGAGINLPAGSSAHAPLTPTLPSPSREEGGGLIILECNSPDCHHFASIALTIPLAIIWHVLRKAASEVSPTSGKKL